MAACTFINGTADTGATPNTSSSYTPTSGRLQCVGVVVTGSTDAAPTLTNSASLGFTLVASEQLVSAGHYLHWFIADALTTTTSSQTVTFSAAADEGTGSVIYIFEVAGMTKTGATAMLQSGGDTGGAAATPDAIFGSAITTTNPTLGIVAIAQNPAAVTPPTGWTEPAGGDLGFASPTYGAECVFRDSGSTDTTVTWGAVSGATWGACMIELDSSASASAHNKINSKLLTGKLGSRI